MEHRSEEEDQDVTTQFMNITGCNRNLTESVLMSHNYNLERSLEYFYGPSEIQPGPSNVIDVDDDSPIAVEDLKGLEVSLLSWNIDGLDAANRASRFQACYYILKRTAADFIFLQEVVNDTRGHLTNLEKNYNIYYSDPTALYFTAIIVCKQLTVKSHQVIHFESTGMGRTLQILEGRLGPLTVFLLNTHLESMAEFSAIRRAQFRECMKKINELIRNNPGCLLYFGGDLNIRDKEVIQESGYIPNNVADAWMAAGGKASTKYTFDMTLNDNKSLGKARCRFDRVYFYGPLDISNFELEGKQRIRSSLCFPSDHFAVSCTFKA